MLISFKEGVTLPDHVHKYQPDLIYVLKGKATFFMDGVGEFPMEPGMVILVPPNTLHAMRRVQKEGLLVYNVFSPATKYTKRKEGKWQRLCFQGFQLIKITGFNWSLSKDS